MKKVTKTLKCIFLVLTMFSIHSCNEWLDLMPANEQVSDRFWEDKEEVKGVLMSAYKQLRSCMPKMLMWGELRGDAVLYQGSGDAALIKKLDILTTNKECKYNEFYTAIGRANSVIKYGPEVLEKDPSFSLALSNSYIAEAIYIRSLCYFYLVRTFGKVPLVLNPYVDDSEAFAVASSSEEVIIEQLLKDLNAYVARCKTGYETDGVNLWPNKGRATRWAYHALMADIYLWKGDYENCIKQCDEVAKGEFFLMETEYWYEIFYPGNSAEGIFEIQYSRQYGATNFLYQSFHNGEELSTWLMNTNLEEMYNKYVERDYRGEDGSYIAGELKIWKYAGFNFQDENNALRSSEQDNNWIVCRYADVLLMKAEALVMKGPEGWDEACLIIEDIRLRAGQTIKIEKPESEFAALEMVLNERTLELLGEGKRWFDVLRVAKRDDYKYKQYLFDVLLSDVSAKEYAIWLSKLQDPNSWYLPIHKDEIENGMGILEQNHYYEEKEF